MTPWGHLVKDRVRDKVLFELNFCNIGQNGLAPFDWPVFRATELSRFSDKVGQ